MRGKKPFIPSHRRCRFYVVIRTYLIFAALPIIHSLAIQVIIFTLNNAFQAMIPDQVQACGTCSLSLSVFVNVVESFIRAFINSRNINEYTRTYLPAQSVQVVFFVFNSSLKPKMRSKI